jgi:DNA primase
MIPYTEQRYFLMTQPTWDKPAKISSNDIAIGCPICEEGKSKGKKQRCHLYYYGENLMVHCFNCGMHHTFRNYLKKYFPQLYKQYMFDIGIFKTPKKEHTDKPKELKLFTFKDIGLNFIPVTESKKGMAYLYSRGVDTKYFKKFYFGKYKNYGEGIVIPFWYNDKIYGFQFRSINKKIFHTYLPEQNKGWKIYNYFTNEKKVYVFESIFDLYSNDIPLENKISSLGSDINIEKLNKFKEVIFCFDNDETGHKKAKKYAELGYGVFIWPDNIPYKDFNDILKDSIKKGKDPKEVRKKLSNLIQKNTFDNISALVRLKLKGY